MRGKVLLAAILIGTALPAFAQDPAPAPAAPAPADEYWKVSGERLSFAPAKLSVPRRVAGAEYFETREFSHEGEGVDTAVKYRSADQKVVATLYVYYPSLAHSGVQAIATDQAIRASSKPQTVRALGTAVASAAGKPGVAVTADYDHYLGGLASKAAFIKAGRWMLKLRVSGPEARSAEVASVMTALLDGLRFEGEVQPHSAQPISAGECATTDRPDAKAVTDGDGAEADATLATLDAAGQPAAGASSGKRKPLPARIGRDWCRTSLQVGDNRVTVLQSTGKGGPRGGLVGDSALLVLIGDAGGVIEVVRLAKEKKYLLVHHAIAEAEVLGRYDGFPSLAQIGRFFVEPVQVRARVRLTAGGGVEVGVPVSPGTEP
ncbi:MAG TPA: hypothetical protein VFP12_06570 [Allosphingosinicella sp.]|nr:hypothetical protein [Allosphingosinicella sp.]